MFEAVELGRKVSREDYEAQLATLRTRLIETHQEIRRAGVPVLLFVAGLDGAGKGTVVHRLNEWLDPRGIDTFSFWKPSDEELERPYFWRFWRALPARGRIAIHFGGWYADVLVDRVERRVKDAAMESALARIAAQERMLAEDGALILKFWYHLSRDAQRKKFAQLRRAPHQRRIILSVDSKPARHYGRFVSAAETMIRRTDSPCAPWQLVEAADDRHRDLTTAQLLLAAMQERLAQRPAPSQAPAAKPRRKRGVTVLSRVDLSQAACGKAYARELEKLQGRLNQLVWKAYARRRSCIAVFEGWDAAGKGSAIRRVTEAIDARLFRVVPVAAPTEEERAHHYLWRFWRHLPRDGMVTVFDRSWYGRLLVERVEGFATHPEWMRAFQEINEFEKQLVEHGTVVLKFWIHISQDEQLRRFRKRAEIAHKHYKITDEDWRNRKQWGAYEAAVHDMVTRTSTQEAPWTVVAGNDKKFARLEILRTCCRALKQGVGRCG